MRHAKIKNFESKLEKLFGDDERIVALFSQEKSSRGVDQKQLVFAGLSDVSAQTFCSLKVVLRAREREKMYFGAYLRDRLLYANEFRILDRWPRSDAEMLQANQSPSTRLRRSREKITETKRYRREHQSLELSLDDDTFEFEVEGADTEYAMRGIIAEFLHANGITASGGIFRMNIMCFGRSRWNHK